MHSEQQPDSLTADDWNKHQGRRNQGKAAVISGRGFEGELEHTHDLYRQRGRADIYRLPVFTQPAPRTWLADPRKFGVVRILAEQQRTDYAGTLGGVHRGRSIVMEAKSSVDRQASLAILRPDQKGGGVKLHQLSAIVHGWRNFGTMGCIVWKNGIERLIFLPPVLTWAFDEFRLGRVRRLQSADGKPYVRGEMGIEDWLTPAVEFLGK